MILKYWINFFKFACNPCLYGSSGGGGPAAPNPTQTAEAQQTLNDVNQTNPYGSLKYTQTGTGANGMPIMTQTQTLSPQMQGLFNSQMGTAGQLGKGEQGLTNQINYNNANAGSNPVNNPGMLQGEFNSQQKAAYNQQMNYLQPQEQQQTGQLKDQLAQQGITQESDPTAYANAMSLNNNNQTFQNQQAFNGSYANGLAGEGQMFNQGLQAQQAPISELSSIQSMANPSNVQFGSTPQSANYMQAAQQNYASQLGSYNNQQQGLYSLGGAALSSGAASSIWSGIGDATIAMLGA